MKSFEYRFLNCFGWLCLAFGLAFPAWAAAPANDNFANAQVLVGDFGTVTNDNTSATAEKGEPSHAGLKAANTLWYKWTANNDAQVEFDTFNSQCDTVLAVYVVGLGVSTNLANLNLLVANDDINPTNPENPNRYGSVTDPYQENPYLGPSGVKFNAKRGTTYFIAVGGTHKDKSGLPATGAITLTWAYNSSGVFRFTSSAWNMQPLKAASMNLSWTAGEEIIDFTTFSFNFYFPDADYYVSEAESYTPQNATYSSSARGARVTVTRLFGSSGRVNVGFELINGTGPYFDALLDTNGPTGTFADYQWPTVKIGGVDVLVTNILFEDGEMSKSLLIPIVNDRGVGISTPLQDNRCEARIGQYPTVSAFDRTFDPYHVWRSFYVRLTNASLALPDPTDPNSIGEDPGVLSPPRLDLGTVGNFGTNDHSTATVTILDMDYDPLLISFYDTTNFWWFGGYAYASTFFITNGVANFERSVHRVREDVGIAKINVYRCGPGDLTKGTHTWYTINNHNPIYNGSPDRDNTFDLQAGSDYAMVTPDFGGTPAGLSPDFTIFTDDTGHSEHWCTSYAGNTENEQSQNSSWGECKWAAGDAITKTIWLSVTNDGIPEFNEDLTIDLIMVANDTEQMDVGLVGSTVVTILHNDYPAGGLDDTFNQDSVLSSDPVNNPMPGANNTVYSLVVQSNDQSVIVGKFSTYNTTPRYGIARISLNGQLDRSFDPGDGVPVLDQYHNYFISTIAQSPGSKFVIGGNFPSYNGISRFNLARVNTDGSLDTSFNPGLGANGSVWAVAVQPDGKVVIGGDFTYVNNYLRGHIARLNADGTVDQSFDPGTNAPNNSVYAVALTTNNSVYVGGEFNGLGSLPRNHLALFNPDGTPNTSFAPATGADGPVHILAIQPNDNRLIIGGDFGVVETRKRPRIARYNPDGNLDATFDPGDGADDTIYSITLQNDGRILIAGYFTSYNQTPRRALARLFPTGELDTSFMDQAYNQFAGPYKPYFNPYANPRDFFLDSGLQSDGKVMVVGSFHYVGGGRLSTAVQTNTAGIDNVAYTRAAYRPRANVARLVGGDTGGPGSMGLWATNYTIDENLGFIYTRVVRANGYLGEIESTFSMPPRLGSNTVGVAQVTADYSYNRVNPHYGTSWAGTHSRSDGIFGTNNIATDPLGNTQTGGLDDINVTVQHVPGFQGDRSANFQLDRPSYADIEFLGGENIPLASALARTTAALTIHEVDVNHGAIFFSATNYFVDENAGQAQITLLRTNGTVGPVQIKFATTNLDAVAGVDYVGNTNTFTFQDGQTVYTNIHVTINNLTLSGPDKKLLMYISNPGGGAVLGGITNATLTIINDNFLPGHVNFTSPLYSAKETDGAVIIAVLRQGGNTGPLDISFATSNLTALAGINYTATNGTLHWDNQDTTPRLISIPVFHDLKVTPDFQFQVTLFNPNPAGALGSVNQTICSIVNVDAYGQLQFSAPVYNVNEKGGYATINVLRVGGRAETISATFNTADSTAYQFLNYFPTNGTLSLGPGIIARTFTVPLLDDGVQDAANFGFNVQLANFSPAAAAPAPALANSFIKILDAQTYNQQPGQLDTEFDPNAGFNDDVFSIARQADSKMVVAGAFSKAAGLPAGRISRLLPNGNLDLSFVATTYGGANDDIRAVLCQTDTGILVGGAFTTMDSVGRNSIARLFFDGSLDTGFNPGSGADAAVFALAETFDAGGARKLMAAGAFSSFNGLVRAGIIRLNNDGTIDTDNNNGVGANGPVYAVVVYPTNTTYGGQALIAGDFTSVNGIARNRIARLNLDGSVDITFDPRDGATNTIRTLAIQPDGGILLGGSFTLFNGQPCNHIARLNADGSVDTAFQAVLGANDTVYALALQPDNRIVVGGQFTRANNATRNRLTRMLPNGAIDPTINFGAGADNFIDALLIQPDGRFVVGGGFTHFQDQPRNHFARVFGGSVTGGGTLTFDSANYVVDENGTNVQVTVIRTDGTTGNVSVDLVTSDNTAVAGVNYSNVNVTLNFPEGETVQRYLIPIRADQQITPDLIVNLALVNPTPPATLGVQPTAVITIINIDSAVQFSAPVYARAENAFDGAATIEIDRTGSTRFPVTVDFTTTTNGTAIAGFNYLPFSTTVNFLPTQTSQFVKVPVLNTPGVIEGDVTVTMQLQNPSGTLLVEPSQATLTIVDVDTAPGKFLFSQTNFFVGEGDGFANITILRTNGHTGPVSVQAITVAGSATPGLKYVPTNYVAQFADGETVKNFQVQILENNFVEGNQIVWLTMTNPTGGASFFDTNTVPLTILDDDVGVSFSTNTALTAIFIVSETNSLATLDVYRLNSTNGTTTVSYATSNGTAVAGINYVADSRTLTFKPGESHKTISFSILRDPRVTGDLAFAVNLFNPSSGVQLAAPYIANVVINDVDSGLSIGSTNVPPIANPTFYVMENSNYAVITVVRTNANTGVVMVNYATEDGTAIAPDDYTSVNGFLVFTNGQLSNTFSIPIIDNNLVDGDRYFSVRLLNPTPPAQLLSPTNATVVINDNDAGFRFSSGTYEVLKNGVSATITVQRVGSTNSTVSVNYSTTSGGTASPSAYTPTSGTLIFTNGEISKSFSVFINDNTIIEGDRTVLLSLSAPTGPSTLVSPSSAVLIIHDNNGSLVVPAGSALLSESRTPPNGYLDPGETVTMLFAFRNAGGTNTANLVATLLATNGVTPVAPASQTYGVVVTNGPAVFRPFTFTANGANGQPVVATFLLTDSGHSVSTNGGIAVFAFTLGTHSASFANTAGIAINDYTPATPYPAIITVSNLDGVITKATVTLTNLNHTAPSDIDALVAAPAGQAMLLMANAGAGNAISKVTLTFDDAVTNTLSQSAKITSGTYQPTAYLPVAPFPVPAPPRPATGYTNVLAAFNGSNPNGDWRLFIIDDTPQDTGAISNGWQLNLTLANPILGASDLGIYMAAVSPAPPNPVVLGSNITYVLTLTNYGPSAATNIVVTNPIPAGTLFVSVTPPANSTANTNGGGLAWTVASLGTNATTSLTLVLQARAPGSITNSAAVSTTGDVNPDDNTAAVATAVVTPSADLALGLSGTPNPVFLGQNLTYSLTVSNLGPGTANAVAVTDTLPAGANFVSASPAGYTVNGNIITFTNLGDLGSGGQLSAAIIVAPTQATTLTDSASCTALVIDPRKLNNTASVKTVVSFVAVNLVRTGNSLSLSWPSDLTAYSLQSATNLTPPVYWTTVTNPAPTGIGGQNTVTLPIGNNSLFFRLFSPKP